MDILRDEDVKTRKEHICFGCRGAIPKGTIAHVHVNNDRGILSSFYTHLSCEKILIEMSADMYYGDTFDEGCIRQYLLDEGFQGTPDEYIEKRDGKKY